MKCLLFHNYSIWGLPTNSYQSKIKQSRVCKDCGKVQVRDIGYEDGLYAAGIEKSLGELIKYCKDEEWKKLQSKL